MSSTASGDCVAQRSLIGICARPTGGGGVAASRRCGGDRVGRFWAGLRLRRSGHAGRSGGPQEGLIPLQMNGSLQGEADPVWWGTHGRPVYECGDVGRGPDVVLDAIAIDDRPVH